MQHGKAMSTHHNLCRHPEKMRPTPPQGEPSLCDPPPPLGGQPARQKGGDFRGGGTILPRLSGKCAKVGLACRLT